jgi:phosphotransferase system IIA component
MFPGGEAEQVSAAQRPVLQLLAPFAGTVMALADLPDPVYARGVVGPGLALVPDPTLPSVEVVSPCDGLVRATAPHAVMLVADHGREVLVHLGVQVVDPAVTESGVVGQRVVVGQTLLIWDTEAARRSGAIMASPLVALQAAQGLVLAVVDPGERVEQGQPLIFWS